MLRNPGPAKVRTFSPVIFVTRLILFHFQPPKRRSPRLKEQSNAKLNVARVIDSEKRPEARIISLPQAVEFLPLQSRNVKRKRISACKSLRDGNMEVVQWYCSCR